MVYTDQNPELVKKNYRHEAANHGVGEYIKGQAHTNGVESFWAMLKRGHVRCLSQDEQRASAKIR